MASAVELTTGTGSSIVVKKCQICDYPDLTSTFFLGYLPPVNTMPTIGERPKEEPSYPAELLFCSRCQLVQLGLIVDPNILFPPTYPYTSGTTKILRENFAQLAEEVKTIFTLSQNDLVVDIGSNDGTLLSNFKDSHKVHGIEPTLNANIANDRGIPTTMSFFNRDSAEKVMRSNGKAKLITATNVFAHIENIHEIVDSIMLMLDEKGVFISESHYLVSLLETLQYDTIYHEHLRYYSLTSLSYLLKAHGLEVIHARRIPTHGGSIRVYAARPGVLPVNESVGKILAEEKAFGVDAKRLNDFKEKVVLSKMELLKLLCDLKKKGSRIYGVGAPSRASTLINYVGLDDGILDCVVEIKGSYKIGKYMPGTMIPVVEESRLIDDNPEYALLLSWHIADELIHNLSKKGYKGEYIIPLTVPRIADGKA